MTTHRRHRPPPQRKDQWQLLLLLSAVCIYGSIRATAVLRAVFRSSPSEKGVTSHEGLPKQHRFSPVLPFDIHVHTCTNLYPDLIEMIPNLDPTRTGSLCLIVVRVVEKTLKVVSVRGTHQTTAVVLLW